MKKTILILMVATIIISCAPTTKVEVIDGCQYLVTSSYNGNGGYIENKCHKGNCTNPIHGNVKVTDQKDSVIVIDTAMINRISALQFQLSMDTVCSMSDKEIKDATVKRIKKFKQVK
jgi:hypothetical protein